MRPKSRRKRRELDRILWRWRNNSLRWQEWQRYHYSIGKPSLWWRYHTQAWRKWMREYVLKDRTQEVLDRASDLGFRMALEREKAILLSLGVPVSVINPDPDACNYSSSIVAQQAFAPGTLRYDGVQEKADFDAADAMTLAFSYFPPGSRK